MTKFEHVEIYNENDAWPDHIAIAPGALRLPNKSLPVTGGFDRIVVLGHADNFVQEGPVVYADITFTDNRANPFKYAIGGLIRDRDENDRITQLDLHSVSIHRL